MPQRFDGERPDFNPRPEKPKRKPNGGSVAKGIGDIRRGYGAGIKVPLTGYEIGIPFTGASEERETLSQRVEKGQAALAERLLILADEAHKLLVEQGEDPNDKRVFQRKMETLLDQATKNAVGSDEDKERAQSFLNEAISESLAFKEVDLEKLTDLQKQLKSLSPIFGAKSTTVSPLGREGGETKKNAEAKIRLLSSLGSEASSETDRLAQSRRGEKQVKERSTAKKTQLVNPASDVGEDVVPTRRRRRGRRQEASAAGNVLETLRDSREWKKIQGLLGELPGDGGQKWSELVQLGLVPLAPKDMDLASCVLSIALADDQDLGDTGYKNGEVAANEISVILDQLSGEKPGELIAKLLTSTRYLLETLTLIHHEFSDGEGGIDREAVRQFLKNANLDKTQTGWLLTLTGIDKALIVATRRGSYVNPRNDLDFYVTNIIDGETAALKKLQRTIQAGGNNELLKPVSELEAQGALERVGATAELSNFVRSAEYLKLLNEAFDWKLVDTKAMSAEQVNEFLARYFLDNVSQNKGEPMPAEGVSVDPAHFPIGDVLRYVMALQSDPKTPIPVSVRKWLANIQREFSDQPDLSKKYTESLVELPLYAIKVTGEMKKALKRLGLEFPPTAESLTKLQKALNQTSSQEEKTRQRADGSEADLVGALMLHYTGIVDIEKQNRGAFAYPSPDLPQPFQEDMLAHTLDLKQLFGLLEKFNQLSASKLPDVGGKPENRRDEGPSSNSLLSA